MEARASRIGLPLLAIVQHQIKSLQIDSSATWSSIVVFY